MAIPSQFTIDCGAGSALPAVVMSAPSYEAIEDDGKRKPTTVRSVSEDRVLKDRQRQRLSATTRQTLRNFAVAQWALNKHLDYTSEFRFRGTTADEPYNRALEELVKDVSRPERFDIAQRHGRDAAVRMLESGRTIDGDGFWAKYAGGRFRGQIEQVEADRVRDEGAPPERRRRRDSDPTEWVNGVEVEKRSGRSVNYAIANRTDSGFAEGRVVGAQNLIACGYYQRPDQVRGVGLLAAALNGLRDVDESLDHARNKVKLSQLMGLLFNRSAEGPLAEYLAVKRRDEYESAGLDPDADEGARYEVNLDGGMFALDMERGESAQLMESKTPATETVNLLKLCIHIAIRSLDLPYSFFDESFTNFYGQRGSFLSYLQGVQRKQKALVEALNRWTKWRLGLAVASGELKLPRGRTFDYLQWEWVPVGQPWWDPAKEITAQLMAIGAGLTTPQRICKETNTDYEQNIDDIAAALKYAREKEVTLSFDTSAAHKAAMADEVTGDRGQGDRRQGAEEDAADGDGS